MATTVTVDESVNGLEIKAQVPENGYIRFTIKENPNEDNVPETYSLDQINVIISRLQACINKATVVQKKLYGN
jgi:hypothetical protein